MKNQIKTFEEACKVLELNHEKVIPDFSFYPKKDIVSMQSHAKLVIIVKAANKIANGGNEWQPDWNNYNERKYFPWFDMCSSGFRYYDYVIWFAFTYVGSRLCFISEDLCEYVSNQFIDLYKDYLEN